MTILRARRRSLLLVPALLAGLLACNEEKTNLPFTFPLTPSPPLLTGPTPIFFTVQATAFAPTQVSAQFSRDGGRSFQNATPAAGTPSLVQLQAQPEGTTGFFFWDPLADLGPGLHRGVVLRVFGQAKGELSFPGDTGRLVVDLSDRFDPPSQPGPALTRPVAAPLPDGTVWVTGGLLSGQLQGTGQRYDPRNRSFVPSSGLGVPRDRPGFALVRASGVVVVAGGVLLGGGLSAAVELHRIDPQSGAARTDLAVPGLTVARAEPAVAGLPDGRAAVLGGDLGGGASSAQVELVAPSALAGAVQGGFTSPLAARVGATATALPDGRVLLAGGFQNGQPVLGCALLDAQGTTLTPGPTLPGPRGEHTAVLLGDGRVALVGGTTVPGSDLDALSTVLAFDPQGDVLVTLPSLQRARRRPAAAWAGGQLLVCGGSGPGAPELTQERLDLDLAGSFDLARPSLLARADAVAVATGSGEALLVGGGAVPEVYTPDGSLTVESFDSLGGRPFSVPEPRADHTATQLDNGNSVLLVGGTSGVTSALATTQLFDAVERRFTPRASLLTARAEHAAAPVANGVLVVGGRGPQGVLGSAELWDRAQDAWTPAGTLQTPRAGHTLLPLLDGRWLVAGGVDQAGQPVAALEVWDPSSRAFSSGGALAQPRGAHDGLPTLGDAVLGPGAGSPAEVTVVLPFSLERQVVALDAPRAGAGLAELVPGMPLVAGGADQAGLPRADAVVVDARFLPFRTLTPVRPLQVARTRTQAVRLFGADTLLVGGRGARGVALDEQELYGFLGPPETGVSRRTLDRRSAKARERHTATRLFTGEVLIVGGVDERGVVIAGAEVFVR